MRNKLIKTFTNNHKEIPLFYVTFDLNKYQKEGEKGSSELNLHPTLREDRYIIEQLHDLIDHIRENYDMEKLAK